MARILIVGGGMSGLSLAWYLRRLKPSYEVKVFEAESRAGGKAWTEMESGFLCERGVNAVLDNKPSTLGLAKELGLKPLRSNDAARRRFIVKKGGLVPLPDSPGQFIKSGLLSLPARLRVVAEIIIRRGDLERDESLADFARRRLGKGAYQYLIDPMASGIYAGDPERLSLKACFPRIYELERDYGSLIRAMIRLQREAKKKGASGPGAGPGGVLTSFERGMGELAGELAARLGDILVLGRRVHAVHRKGRRWIVEFHGGGQEEGSHLVIACPAGEANRILGKAAPEIASIASSVYYPPISVVCLGIRKNLVKNPLDGFGFLAPFVERRPILGALWDSSIFKGRAPQDYHLLRVLVGGARLGRIAGLPDDSLVDLVQKELSYLVGLRGTPDFARIFRWRESIPQYNVGYLRMMNELEGFLEKYPGLFIRCNWVGGVSLNDCIANSKALAKRIAAL